MAPSRRPQVLDLAPLSVPGVTDGFAPGGGGTPDHVVEASADDGGPDRAAPCLPDDLALVFRGLVNDAAVAAIARWRLLTVSGDDVKDADAELDALLQEAFLADDGEPGADRSGHVAGPLQRGLCLVVDVARRRICDEAPRSQRRRADVRRLGELRNVADKNRSWLWAIENRVVWLLTITLLLCARCWVLRSRSILFSLGVCRRHVLDLQGKHALC